MKKFQFIHLFFTIGICIGFILTTVKMFAFHDDKDGFINNARWEQSLEKCGAYDKGCIMFFGDSILDLWWMCPSFGGLPVRNRGISGNRLYEMIERYDRDVLRCKPFLIVQDGGLNDMGTGRTDEQILADMETLLRLSSDNGIKIILLSLTPVNHEYKNNHPLQRILYINSEYEKLARKFNAVYVDMYSLLKDEKGDFKAGLTRDGGHPTPDAYLLMSNILLPEITAIIPK